MAEPKKPDVVEDPEVTRVLKMVAKAETDRNRHLGRIHDCYKYAMPWRHKANQSQPQDQLDEIFDEEPMTVLEDFSADMLNTFTPQKSEWVTPKPVETFDAAQLKQLEKPLANHKRVVFSELARSNFYQSAHEAYLDLGPGTCAMIITDLDAAAPLHCQAVPSTDLLLNRGPFGRPDGIWRKWLVKGEDIPILWPRAVPVMGADWTDKPAEEFEVVDGAYRAWEKRDAETWVYVVVIAGKRVWRDEQSGAGSCPFIVARWSRDSTTAWGVGPTYRTLPAIKTLNHLRYTSLKNYDKEADPVVSYEDDGMFNFDQGINPGDWIPRAPGSNKPEVIEARSRLDLTIFQIDEIRTAIRRAHYQDRPEQKGKTPPTAEQWSDEAIRRARRMGSPASNLVIEWAFPVYMRVAFLLEKRGKLPKVTLNGAAVALEPVSPLIRAQEQEEIQRLDRGIAVIQARFGPELVNLLVKQIDAATYIFRRMGNPVELIRTETELAEAMQQFAPLLKGTIGEGADPNAPQQGV